MEVLKKGTIEPILVAMRDRLENISDLSLLSGRSFEIRAKSDDSVVQASSTWATDADFPMTAICQVDTTVAAFTGGSTYKLYLTYSDGGETPIHGPIYFRVEDD